jgi:hypothetical protein
VTGKADEIYLVIEYRGFGFDVVTGKSGSDTGDWSLQGGLQYAELFRI